MIILYSLQRLDDLYDDIIHHENSSSYDPVPDHAPAPPPDMTEKNTLRDLVGSLKRKIRSRRLAEVLANPPPPTINEKFGCEYDEDSYIIPLNDRRLSPDSEKDIARRRTQSGPWMVQKRTNRKLSILESELYEYPGTDFIRQSPFGEACENVYI